MLSLCKKNVGQDRSVGIATRCGLDGPGIEFWCRRGFRPSSRPTLRPSKPPIQWVPGLSPGVKRPGRNVEHPSPYIYIYIYI